MHFFRGHAWQQNLLYQDRIGLDVPSDYSCKIISSGVPCCVQAISEAGRWEELLGGDLAKAREALQAWRMQVREGGSAKGLSREAILKGGFREAAR